MPKKHHDAPPPPKLSPTRTVRDMSEEFMTELNIPDLPSSLPHRLEQAIHDRVQSLLYHLKEAKRQEYVKPLEVRLVRDAHRAVITAYELGLREAETWYAAFRQLVEELGYERVDVGFSKFGRGDEQSFE
jgi:hypothetical protein